VDIELKHDPAAASALSSSADKRLAPQRKGLVCRLKLHLRRNLSRSLSLVIASWTQGAARGNFLEWSSRGGPAANWWEST